MHVVFVCENTELYGPIPIKTNNDALLLLHIHLWLIKTSLVKYKWLHLVDLQLNISPSSVQIN